MKLSRLSSLRILLVAALGLSAALLADQLDAGTELAFCTGEAAGCAAVMASPLSTIFGVPLPALGLGALGLILLLSFLGARATRIVQLALAGGGIIGLGLIGYQGFVIGDFCPLCVGVDLIAMGLAGIAFSPGFTLSSRGTELPALSWLALAAVFIAAPLVYRAIPEKEEIPEFILEIQRETGADIVEIIDFTCGYCRQLQGTIGEMLRDDPSIKVHRVVVPFLAGIRGMEAAIAYRCAEREALADEFARLLSEDSKFHAGSKIWAEELAGGENRLLECMEDPTIRASIAEMKRKVREAGLTGLPMTYIGGRSLKGAGSSERFENALRVKRLGLPSGRPSPLAAGAGVLFLSALILIPSILYVRRKRR